MITSSLISQPRLTNRHRHMNRDRVSKPSISRIMLQDRRNNHRNANISRHSSQHVTNTRLRRKPRRIRVPNNPSLNRLNNNLPLIKFKTLHFRHNSIHRSINRRTNRPIYNINFNRNRISRTTNNRRSRRSRHRKRRRRRRHMQPRSRKRRRDNRRSTNRSQRRHPRSHIPRRLRNASRLINLQRRHAARAIKIRNRTLFNRIIRSTLRRPLRTRSFRHPNDPRGRPPARSHTRSLASRMPRSRQPNILPHRNTNLGPIRRRKSSRQAGRLPSTGDGGQTRSHRRSTNEHTHHNIPRGTRHHKENKGNRYSVFTTGNRFTPLNFIPRKPSHINNISSFISRMLHRHEEIPQPNRTTYHQPRPQPIRSRIVTVQRTSGIQENKRTTRPKRQHQISNHTRPQHKNLPKRYRMHKEYQPHQAALKLQHRMHTTRRPTTRQPSPNTSPPIKLQRT